MPREVYTTCRLRNPAWSTEVPINPELLEILICPACKGSLRPVDEESGLACAGCGRVYPIKDGIPVLIVDEGVLPEGDAEER